MEKISIALRHSRMLGDAAWLWDGVRPVYNAAINVLGSRGLSRLINGSDSLLISPAMRDLSEAYEPEVWRHLMAEVMAGDVVADVGAYVGLYTVALAKRVGPKGHVFAFEPDRRNASLLTEHIGLNGVADRVDLIPAAVGESEGTVEFVSNYMESHITSSVNGGALTEAELSTVRLITLDSVFAKQKVDVLKIDVEGYEEMVLRGARELLTDKERGPRSIYIEVHPFAWPALGVSGDSLLNLLAQFNFITRNLNGEYMDRIVEYGEVIAQRQPA